MARREKGYVCEQDDPKGSTLPATVRLALLSGLIWGWLLIAMGQTAIAGAGSDASPAMLSFSWQIAFIALLAISLPLAKKGRPAPSLFASLAFGLATATLLVAQPLVPSGELLQYLVLRQVLMGATCASLLCLWSRMARPLSARRGSFQMLCAGIVAVLALTFYMALTVPARFGLLVLMLVAVALDVLLAPLPPEEEAPASPEDRSEFSALVPLAICAYSLLSFAFRTVFTPSAGISIATTSFAGVVVTGAFALYFQRRPFVLRTGLWLASGFVLLICLSALLVILFPESGLHLIAFLLNTAAFLLGGLMFFLPGTLASAVGKPACLGFRLAAFLFFASRLASEILVTVFALDPPSALVLALIFLVISLLVLIFGFFYTGLPHRSPAASASPLEDKCAHLAKEHDLTEREAAVLVPLAKGHTMKSIAEQFTVSFHTVRSQVRSISKETGHSFARGAPGYARIAVVSANPQLRSTEAFIVTAVTMSLSTRTEGPS